MKKRLWFIVPSVILIVLLLPFTASAITDTQITAILGRVITGVIDAGRDAYCAAGVVALCP